LQYKTIDVFEKSKHVPYSMYSKTAEIRTLTSTHLAQI